MNIMIINHYAGSDRYGMEFRPLYLGRELVKQGHRVTVLAADCSHLRILNPKVKKDFSEEWIEGVRYVWVKTVSYQKNDVRRFLNMISFLQKITGNAKLLAKKYQPDVIVASSTYPYDVKAAKRIAAFGKEVKVCYEIHDIWPLSLIELYHISKNNPYMRSLQRAENYAYENSDLVISILPDVDRHIKQLGYHSVPYVHIPNGIVISGKQTPPVPQQIFEIITALKKRGKFIVMYLGGFSKANALDDLISSASVLPKQAYLVLVGDGPLKPELIQMAKEKSIRNICILPAVAKPEVLPTLMLADALYIGAKRVKLYEFGVSMNKIFDYMLAKKPIIYAIEASNDPIAEAECGISIEPENPEEISRAVQKLMSLSQEERDSMGLKAEKYVKQNHDYQILSQQFISAMKEIGCRHADH